MTQPYSKFFAVFLLALAVVLGGCASMQGPEKQRVVLQLSDDNPKNWHTAFNVVNNMVADLGKENVEIEIVAFSDGIHALTFDSKVAGRIPVATEKGVKVVACENSMKRFKLSRGDMANEVTYKRVGVLHIIARQKEGWNVIRP